MIQQNEPEPLPANWSFTNLAFDQCALCAESSELQASHIIPRFVFDWLTKTSATGHFRSSQNPNLRVQDGFKPRMLCKECEQLFSSWEKKFSENCFVPINSGNVDKISYGPWMLKFATSVSWRVLRVFDASGYLAECNDHITTRFNHALSEWSRFLLGDAPHPGSHEQHIFLVGEINYTSISNMPPPHQSLSYSYNRYWCGLHSRYGNYLCEDRKICLVRICWDSKTTSMEGNQVACPQRVIRKHGRRDASLRSWIFVWSCLAVDA